MDKATVSSEDEGEEQKKNRKSQEFLRQHGNGHTNIE